MDNWLEEIIEIVNKEYDELPEWKKTLSEDSGECSNIYLDRQEFDDAKSRRSGFVEHNANK